MEANISSVQVKKESDSDKDKTTMDFVNIIQHKSEQPKEELTMKKEISTSNTSACKCHERKYSDIGMKSEQQEDFPTVKTSGSFRNIFDLLNSSDNYLDDAMNKLLEEPKLKYAS